MNETKSIVNARSGNHTDYSPQKHALAIADTNTILVLQTQQVAALHGKMDRILTMLASMAGDSDPDLDSLVEAAFDAMGNRTWIVGELLSRALGQDAAANELMRVITAGAKISPKSLGGYLAKKIPAHRYVTDSGLEISRGPKDAGAVTWSISKV